jgi:hypothetical protein
VVLLTFSSNIALEGFLSRINQWLSSNFYQLTENERIKIYTAELTGQVPEKQLKALME